MTRVLWLYGVVSVAAMAQPVDVVTQVSALYADGEFAAAVKAAETALKKPLLAEEAPLQVWRGLSLLALGKEDKARGAFGLALKKDAAARLDTTGVPPRALTIFEAARAELLCKVTVISTDGEGGVHIDGAAVGPPPLTLKLPVGPHRFELHASDGRVARSERLAKYEEVTLVELTLPPLTIAPPMPPLAVTQPPLPPAAETNNPEKPKLKWWGLIPITLGAGGLFWGTVLTLYGVNNGDDSQIAGGIAINAACVASIVFGSWLIYRSGQPDPVPTVSFFFAPGGGGITVRGGF